MRSSFDKPTTIRMKQDVRDRVKALADREGNTEAAVLRRVVAAGLDALGPKSPSGSPDQRQSA